ncbi:MAG: alpha/beta fold hydrolase [Proteobacteria bacterium]|nr:alpha/beta fold hydrolase [Pseudomonadota bacterium]
MNTAEASYRSLWGDLRGASFEQGYLDAGGIRTRYLRSGRKGAPLLVLLHGTGGHAECYARNLAAHGEHFDTYAIDMVGHGWSDKPDTPYEIAVYVEHLRAVLDALGHQRAHVSGESLGGWVAARFALEYPERVARLCLNTTGGATMNLDVMAKIKASSRAAVDNPSWEAVHARLAWLMADPASVTDDLVACRQAIYQQADFPRALDNILVLQEPDIRQRNNLAEAEWRAIRAPTLVVWTSHDPTAPHSVGERIAALIPDARFTLMADCGHWPQFEDAATFNRLHIDFLLAGA